MPSRTQSFALAAVAFAAVGVPAALTAVREPPTRDCSSDAYGDLGSSWRQNAVHAGPVAFVGMRNGTRQVQPVPRGRSWPLKVLVVLEPRTAATVTVAARTRSVASLAYGDAALRRVAADGGGSVPLAAGDASVRFEACGRAHVGEAWNRGTQFPGYFLVSGRRCVDIIVRVEGRPGPLRRTLRFGLPRC